MAGANSNLGPFAKLVSDNTELNLSILGFAMLKLRLNLFLQHQQRLLGCDGCLNVEHTLLLLLAWIW